MRFARKELGMRGGFLRPNPYNTGCCTTITGRSGRGAELDSIGCTRAPRRHPQVGVDRFETAARHIISHTMEMMLAG